MTSNHTTASLIAAAARRLQGSSEVAGLDAELLLAHHLRTSRARLKSHPEDRHAPESAAGFLALIERRAAGEPVAYIVGHKDFWTLRLAVDPHVLVPRPETELLLERALARGPERAGSVADLGTGSGAIALALASERAEWRLVATDLSADALECARRNAAALGLRGIEFVLGDWLAPLISQRFEVIVSNPPYIAAADPALGSPELKYEPRLALAAGPDGLACLRTIVRQAPEHLVSGGWLLLEHGATQAAAVARELVARGFGHVRSHCDLAGHERVTEARWH
jgi:release factor glutamine methyltransferase